MSSSRLMVGTCLFRRSFHWASKSKQQPTLRLLHSIAATNGSSKRTIGTLLSTAFGDMSPLAQTQQGFSPQLLYYYQHQQLRWRHSARKGNHLEVLDDMAHTKERETAEERRKKKKERKAAKKEKKKGGKHPEASASTSSRKDDHEDDDDHDDDEDDNNDDENAEVELPNPKKIQTRMLSIVRKFEDSLKSIRGAEPTPELFEDVLVHAYDSETTPLKAVAQVVIVSPTLASVSCFDPSLLKAVREAIQLQLNLNPQEDGAEGDGVLRVPLPKVSLERRQETATQLGKKAENFRQRIRRVRRRYNGIIKQGKEGKLEHISKDDVFRVAKEIDAATESAIANLNKVADEKHDSIMNVG